ncbi:HK97 family phage prohead protease [Salipiger sp. PrR003]|uniref:HK97 family phage prohead protease n=1 Tax=Salipiger sp. PrR003 TaxID=2706776 RepID=UPI0013DD3A33|nr:HK97 family phage prohead protease [Salipiger sp. PrR003]NDV52171.1 HK97 family phage prohead protease [Salipiger sp. PrR003]NDV52197.1 HK97 family phage prohead protease [Salipiger sp. PrR003]
MDRVFLETKFDAADDGSIEGLAWPYGQGDRVGDWIQKGAFASASLPIPMLFAHDQKEPVGVWESADDREDGLHLKGRLLVSDVVRAREVRALVQAGAVRGISIGFRTKKAMRRARGGRTITDLELLEASLVTIPMHPGARVTSTKTAVRALTLAAQLQRASAQLAKRT